MLGSATGQSGLGLGMGGGRGGIGLGANTGLGTSECVGHSVKASNLFFNHLIIDLLIHIND